MTNAIRKSAAVTLALAMLTVVSRAADVFVECESFAELGGWVVDAYSMRNMGSAYVMAHGCGRPVADAVGTVTVPAQGKYAVWARTRNWNAEWTKGAAGRFRIDINMNALSSTSSTSFLPTREPLSTPPRRRSLARISQSAASASHSTSDKGAK